MPNNNPANSQALTRQLKDILDRGSVAALATIIEGADCVGSKLLVEQSGDTFGSFGDPSLDDAVRDYARRFLESRDVTNTFSVGSFAPELSQWRDARVMFERVEPEPRLVICGAGHVGASLARFASLSGYRVTLIDDRAEFLSRKLFPDENIHLVVAESWRDSVRAAIGNGHSVAVAVVTRGHNEDEACLQAIMSIDIPYVGLIGSKRRTRIVLERLQHAGFDEKRIANVHAPIGLDIGAVTPEEVALAILAEIIADRRGGTGVPLSAMRRAKG